MSKKKEAAGAFEQFCDDALNALVGLFDGDVDDGPPTEKEKTRARIRDEQPDDDDSDDGDDDSTETTRPAARKQNAAEGFVQTLRIEHVTGGGRGPGRPKGSAPKKKPEPADDAQK